MIFKLKYKSKKMEPYWKQEFEINLGDKESHLVCLYKYSERSIALISTPEFGKSFSKEFKKIDGKFNQNLKINDGKKSGWIFKAQTEIMEGLNDLLKGIYEGEIKPLFSGIVAPDFSQKSKHNKVFNLINKLMEMLPEDKEEFVISEDDKAKTTIYYNSDEDTVYEGDLVYSFESSKKKFEVYQLVL